MASDVRALIITGFGLNCEAETAHAFTLAGAAPEKVHLNDLLDGRRALDEFHVLAFIGGFSFGDHIASGRVLANRLKHRLAEPIQRFIADGKLIIGICNGFQTMAKLGILPGLDGDYRRQTVTLTNNDSGVFRDAWVRLRVEPDSPCVFTRGLERLDLPVRHGEGKFLTLDDKVLERLERERLVACRYADPATGEPTVRFPHNPNGSVAAIAGICDPTGRVFGLMPHPEAHLFPWNHPHWMRRAIASTLPAEGEGVAIFRNAVAFARDSLV
ncbi:MAG TPA: phosphoribosylformylglycinamidine synthase subunit PurQ [Planctomycetota bacterium]|nr:phosphoribosylformylglycinamidine synthase subunit PurQ [Planctomycetota bacterium]